MSYLGKVTRQKNLHQNFYFRFRSYICEQGCNNPPPTFVHTAKKLSVKNAGSTAKASNFAIYACLTR